MKKSVALPLVGLLLGIALYLQACKLPGDVGSPECGAVQVEAQEAVEAGAPYWNHGQMVSTAAHVVSEAEESGEITEACASCIMNQFARRIPIEEQESCGPEPGDSCGSGMVMDCVLTCVDEAIALSWIGDGYCDDGTYGMVLTCPAFNNDGGDCL